MYRFLIHTIIVTNYTQGKKTIIKYPLVFLSEIYSNYPLILFGQNQHCYLSKQDLPTKNMLLGIEAYNCWVYCHFIFIEILEIRNVSLIKAVFIFLPFLSFYFLCILLVCNLYSIVVQILFQKLNKNFVTNLVKYI